MNIETGDLIDDGRDNVTVSAVDAPHLDETEIEVERFDGSTQIISEDNISECEECSMFIFGDGKCYGCYATANA